MEGFSLFCNGCSIGSGRVQCLLKYGFCILLRFFKGSIRDKGLLSGSGYFYMFLSFRRFLGLDVTSPTL